MNTQLTSTEIQTTQQLLQNNESAQKALAILTQNNGDLETSFDQLWQEKFGRQDYGKGKSLLQLTLNEIRAEICGDEGFRSQFKEYTKNPGSAPLLTGLIVSICTLTALPIDPAIATIVMLYILKIGLNVFCKYTEPEAEE